MQTLGRDLTFPEFKALVAQIARDCGMETWHCSKMRSIHAGWHSEGSTKYLTWSAEIGNASASRDNPRDCIMMLIANIVAERHL